MVSQKEKNAKIYAFLAVLLWATVFIPTKHLLKKYTPAQIGEWRYLVAAILLAGAALIRKEKLPKKKDIPFFFAGGILGFSFYVTVFNLAASMLPSGTCSFVVTTSAIFTTVLSAIFLREPVRPKEIGSLVIQLCGVGVLTLSGETMFLNRGVLLMVAGAVAMAVYNLIQRELAARGYSAMQIATYCIICGAGCLFLFTPGGMEHISELTLTDMAEILYLGAAASALAYFFWTKALSLTEKTGTVSNFMFWVPFLTLLIGRVMLQEIPGVQVYVGGGLLTIGFFLYMDKGKTKERRVKKC